MTSEKSQKDNNVEINIPVEENNQPITQNNLNLDTNFNNDNKIAIEILSNVNTPTSNDITEEKLDNESESDSTTIDNDNDKNKNGGQTSEMKRHSMDKAKIRNNDEYSYEIEYEEMKDVIDNRSYKSQCSSYKSESMIDLSTFSEKILNMGMGTQPLEPIKYLKPREKMNIGFIKQFTLSRVYITAAVSALTIYIATIINHIILKKYIGQNSNEEGIEDWKQRYTVFMYFYILLISPLAEEFVFRKVIFCFFRRYSLFIGYIVSCFLYAIAHFGFSFYKMYEEIKFFPIYFIIGVILTYTYNYDGFLASSLLSNMLYNLIKVLLEFKE